MFSEKKTKVTGHKIVLGHLERSNKFAELKTSREP